MLEVIFWLKCDSGIKLNHCSPSFFHSSFFSPTFGTNSHTLFNPIFPPGLQNSCSPPSLIFPHPKPQYFFPPLIHPKPSSFKFPAFLPVRPCSVHLVYPVFPVPSRSLLQISSCVYSPLFSASLSHPSCLLLPLLYVLCVSSHISRDGVYKNSFFLSCGVAAMLEIFFGTSSSETAPWK